MFYPLSVIIILIISCECQRDAGLPLSYDSFMQLFRTSISVPNGRSMKLDDVIFRFYGTNTTIPTSYQLRDVKRLLGYQNFNLKRPTLVYTHGYIELSSDSSVLTVVKAYQNRGGYNILVLDWANLAFGNYFNVALDVSAIGKETGIALVKLLKRGLSLQELHLIGHSLGAHLLSVAAKTMDSKGFKVPRLTGLDPAYPGFYPALLGSSISSSDAKFVDIIHTDGGGFGGPSSTGHADFWSNGGHAKQPGCLSATVPLTYEDFCSHWRSWEFWAESVQGGEFLARECPDYDSFLRGKCQDRPLVYMGIDATSDLRGNFYIRTGAKSPYALGERGAG